MSDPVPSRESTGEIETSRAELLRELKFPVSTHMAAPVRFDRVRDRAALQTTVVLALILALGVGFLTAALTSEGAAILLGAITFAGTTAISLAGTRRPSSLISRRSRYSVSALSEWGSVGNHLTREARMVLLAAKAADRITGHEVWKSEWLDTQRLRLNPVEQVEQIHRRAQQLRQLRAELGTVPTTEPAVSLYYQQIAALGRVDQALTDRTAALRSYADQLDALHPVLETMNSVQNLEKLNERIDQLVGQTVSDEFGTDNTLALRAELAHITTALQVVVGYIGRPAQLP